MQPRDLNALVASDLPEAGGDNSLDAALTALERSAVGHRPPKARVRPAVGETGVTGSHDHLQHPTHCLQHAVAGVSRLPSLSSFHLYERYRANDPRLIKGCVRRV